MPVAAEAAPTRNCGAWVPRASMLRWRAPSRRGAGDRRERPLPDGRRTCRSGFNRDERSWPVAWPPKQSGLKSLPQRTQPARGRSLWERLQSRRTEPGSATASRSEANAAFFCRSGFSRDTLYGECLSRLKPLLQGTAVRGCRGRRCYCAAAAAAARSACATACSDPCAEPGCSANGWVLPCTTTSIRCGTPLASPMMR